MTALMKTPGLSHRLNETVRVMALRAPLHQPAYGAWTDEWHNSNDD